MINTNNNSKDLNLNNFSNDFNTNNNNNNIITTLNDVKIITSIPLLANSCSSNTSSKHHSLRTSLVSLENNMINISLARKYQLIAILSFSFSNIIVKILIEQVNHKFPQLNYTSIRFFGIFIISLISILYNNIHNINSINNNNKKYIFKEILDQLKILIDIKDFKWIFIRTFAWIMCFTSFSNALIFMKIGTAILLIMLSPIIQNIIFSVYFKTPLDFKYMYSCCVSIIGIYLMLFSNKKILNNKNEYNNDNNSYDINDNNNKINIIITNNNNNHSYLFDTSEGIVIGSIFCILNSIFLSILLIGTKNLNKVYSLENINYICSFWGCIVIFVLSIIFDYKSLIYYLYFKFFIGCFLISILSYIGFLYANKAVVTTDISKISYLMYIQLPVLTLFGIIVYGESYSLIEYIGFLIVLTTCLYTTLFIK